MGLTRKRRKRWPPSTTPIALKPDFAAAFANRGILPRNRMGPGRTGSWRLPQGPWALDDDLADGPRLDHEVLPQAGPGAAPPSATVPSTLERQNCGKPRVGNGLAAGNRKLDRKQRSYKFPTENPERARDEAPPPGPPRSEKISKRSWVRTQRQ